MYNKKNFLHALAFPLNMHKTKTITHTSIARAKEDTKQKRITLDFHRETSVSIGVVQTSMTSI